MQKIILYFYGISNQSIWCNLMLLSTNTFIDLDYSYGASKITFIKKDRKIIGKAISKALKNKRFRYCCNFSD